MANFSTGSTAVITLDEQDTLTVTGQARLKITVGTRPSYETTTVAPLTFGPFGAVTVVNLTGLSNGTYLQQPSLFQVRVFMVDMTAAQIASPTADQLAATNILFQLNQQPYTIYQTNGTALVALGAGGGGGTWGSITGTLSSQTDLNTALGLKAPLANPVFTGDPQAPTAATSDNDTSIATTAFVKAAIAAAAAGGTTGQLLVYKMNAAPAVSPVAPQTRYELARVSVPANKIGINAKVTFWAVAGKVTGGAGAEQFEMYVVPAASTTFLPATNRINTSNSTGTGVNAGTVFNGQVLGNKTDRTNLKFAGNAIGPSFIANSVSSQFVGLTAISAAVPTSAGIDFVITTTTATDTTTVYDCWVEIHDPDATSSGAFVPQPTVWTNATVPGVNTSPILLDYTVTNNYYIPTPIDNIQKIYFSTITDGQQGELILKGGAFQGNWPVFTTPWQQSTVYALGQLAVSAANNIYMVTTAGTSLGSGAGPTGTTTFSDNTVTWTYQSASPGVTGNMGWNFQQPGGAAPVADASTLNGTRIAYKARVIAGATCLDAVVQNVITLNP